MFISLLNVAWKVYYLDHMPHGIVYVNQLGGLWGEKINTEHKDAKGFFLSATVICVIVFFTWHNKQILAHKQTSRVL